MREMHIHCFCCCFAILQIDFTATATFHATTTTASELQRVSNLIKNNYYYEYGFMVSRIVENAAILSHNLISGNSIKPVWQFAHMGR